MRRSQQALAQSFDYARARGLKVCLGFELVGDPTDAEVQTHLEARISALLGNYPMLDAVWFFQSENMGNAGTEAKPGTPLDASVQKHAATFAYLGSPQRVAEGARLTEFFNLAEIRSQLAAIHQEMLSAGQREGIERIDWLTTTIDWVTSFDRAIHALQVDGAAQKLLGEAEASKSRGDAAAAKQKGREAWDAVAASGLREAVQTYPRKMSTMSEFGTLTRIQVKAYATYLDLRDRAQAVSGEAPPEPPSLPVPAGAPPLIVGRQPHCLVAAGQELPVACVVVSGEPVGSCVLHYRQLGAARWTDVALANSFRRTYTAAIAGTDLSEEHVGVEWYVSAAGPSNRPAFWPKGDPSVVWSASIVPQAERKGTCSDQDSRCLSQFSEAGGSLLGSPK